MEPNQIIRHIDLFLGVDDQGIDLGDQDSKVSLKQEALVLSVDMEERHYFFINR